MDISSKSKNLLLYPTKDQYKPVYEAIQLAEMKDRFSSKTLCRFNFNYKGNNVVCFEDLNDIGLIKPKIRATSG